MNSEGAIVEPFLNFFEHRWLDNSLSPEIEAEHGGLTFWDSVRRAKAVAVALYLRELFSTTS